MDIKELFDKYEECVVNNKYKDLSDDELRLMISVINAMQFKEDLISKALKGLSKECARRTSKLLVMNMENLKQCFETAIENNSKYVAVKIETRGSEGAEIIINPRCNFENKLEYYQKAYTDDLVLKTYDGIRIVGFCDSDDFQFIEFMLGDN